MNRLMKKIVAFITISMLLFTLVGCSLNSSSNKIPNNLLGIKEISKEGLTAKIVLNENNICGEKYLSLTHYEDFRVSCTLSNVNKMNNDYDIKKRGSDVIITITGIYDEDVVRDKNKPVELMTISINNDTSISFVDDKIVTSCVIWGGECSDTYTQTYDKTTNTWSDIENEFKLYPMTVE